MAELGNFQDEAYEAIQRKIMHMELKPGERIVKKQLEQELGIGATPVREAILRLRREGLLSVLPQSGTFVAKISLTEVYQARFVRESIEKLVVAEVIPQITTDQLNNLYKLISLQAVYLHSNDYDSFFNLDEKFHKSFYMITQKNFVWNWLQVVNLQFNRFRYLRLEVTDLDWKQIFEDHSALVDSIANKQVERAMAIVSRHLHMVDEDIKVARKVHTDYFE